MAEPEPPATAPSAVAEPEPPATAPFSVGEGRAQRGRLRAAPAALRGCAALRSPAALWWALRALWWALPALWWALPALWWALRIPSALAAPAAAAVASRGVHSGRVVPRAVPERLDGAASCCRSSAASRMLSWVSISARERAASASVACWRATLSASSVMRSRCSSMVSASRSLAAWVSH